MVSPSANNSANAQKYEKQQMEHRTEFCGSPCSTSTLRCLSWFVIICTILCAGLLGASSIWALDAVMNVQSSSCCLPLACNATGTLILQARPHSVPYTAPDNGFCSSISPAVARRMNCLSELTMMSDSNCTVRKESSSSGSSSGGSRCRNRVTFPTELGIASAAVGIGGCACIVLFLLILGTDFYFDICDRRTSKFPPTLILFALVLLCSCAGLWCVVRPLNVALKSHAVEMDSGAYASSNVYIDSTSSTVHSPIFFSDGCGSLSRTRSQVVGFLSTTTGDANDIPLADPFLALTASHGLVFFFAIVCLAVSWHSGGMLKMLLWSEDDQYITSDHMEGALNEKTRHLAESIYLDRLKRENATGSAMTELDRMHQEEKNEPFLTNHLGEDIHYYDEDHVHDDKQQQQLGGSNSYNNNNSSSSSPQQQQPSATAASQMTPRRTNYHRDVNGLDPELLKLRKLPPTQEELKERALIEEQEKQQQGEQEQEEELGGNSSSKERLRIQSKLASMGLEDPKNGGAESENRIRELSASRARTSSPARSAKLTKMTREEYQHLLLQKQQERKDLIASHLAPAPARPQTQHQQHQQQQQNQQQRQSSPNRGRQTPLRSSSTSTTTTTTGTRGVLPPARDSDRYQPRIAGVAPSWSPSRDDKLLDSKALYKMNRPHSKPSRGFLNDQPPMQIDKEGRMLI